MAFLKGNASRVASYGINLSEYVMEVAKRQGRYSVGRGFPRMGAEKSNMTRLMMSALDSFLPSNIDFGCDAQRASQGDSLRARRERQTGSLFRDAYSRGSSFQLVVGRRSIATLFIGRPGWVRSNAWICDFFVGRENDGMGGWIDIEPDESRSLSMNFDRWRA